MAASASAADGGSPGAPSAVRDSFGRPGAVAAARERPMSERLELAISWNAVAAELRAGLAGLTAPREVPPMTSR